MARTVSHTELMRRKREREENEREDSDAHRPSKKVATAQRAGTVQVELLKSGKAPGPILVSHPGLNYPSKISFQPYQHKDTSSVLLQSSAHPRLDYTAQEETDGSADSLLKDYVGVYDPGTGKLQVVEVQRVTLRSTLRSEMEELNEQKAKVAAAALTNTAKRHALAAEFGSKRSKKAIAAMAENAISRGRAADPSAAPKNEAVASAVLQNMSDTTAAMPTKEQLASSVDTSKPRPVPNLAAEHPADVYTTDAIIGKELMSLIPVKDWVDAAQAGTGVNVHSRFVASRMLKFAKAKDVQKLKVLRFVLLCINFNSALGTRGKGPKRIPHQDQLQDKMGDDVPGPVIAELRRKFASENNDMTRWHVDNLMTHVLAAALIVENYEMDTKELRDDLAIDTKEIKQYFHELGCRVAKPNEGDRTRLKIASNEAAQHSIAKLRLPLQFPKIGMGQRARKF
ncbi:DNA-directed RNA polymeras-like protein I 49 kDa polypeptide [Lophiostoma macrostomum CBS 122681]|uniref:DNA-directed RNA polymeras-like protein I 49 kDa polypeptide n=1 Tax=Lophiostoma macrostomum CBS 122681 TaxID=1314788 RepID=A0A6A6SXB5_9PLEO|nr:DNA-directed RNA polymeras-like protein I 49 kDa polypeptide [Lophiostoma macrostomum CBS 122681]